MSASSVDDDRVVQLLEELVTWARFANRSALVETIRLVMKDPKHLRAYEATDGTKTQGEVGELAALSQQAISALWSKWRKLGLVTGKDRLAHVARPSDLGIEVPPRE